MPIEFANAAQRDFAAWIDQRWRDNLAQVVESMTGERPAVRSIDGAEEPLETGEAIEWTQPFSLGAEAALEALFPAPAWREIGSAALRAVGIEDSDEPSIRGTFLEIVSQAFSALAQDLTHRLGQPVLCAEGREEGRQAGVRFRSQANETPESAFDLFVSPELVSAALALLEEEPQTMAAAAETGAGGSGVPAPPAVPAPPRTLDLLLDVELPVSISFGRAQVPLKDVLKLTSGSIVELNRTVSEPVEVIVNNCVIARGEVVVVEGNYGVRIQEIVSRQDRIRTLN